MGFKVVRSRYDSRKEYWITFDNLQDVLSAGHVIIGIS